MLKEKNVFVDLAQKALQKGDGDRAITEYENALKIDPKDFKLHNTLGDLYARKNKIQEAIKEYSFVAENEKERGFSLRAVALYKKISRLAPDLPEAYEKMGELYIELKLPFEAKENYQWLFSYYDKKGDKRKKVEILKNLLKLEPGDANLRTKFAQICIDAGMQSEAASEFVKIGAESFKKGNIKEAIVLFEKAIQFNPDSFVSYKWLGKCYFNEDEIDKAIPLFEKTLILNPDDIDNLTFLAKCYCRVESEQKAIDIFKRILILEPSLTEIRLRLARLYIKNGVVNSAKTEFLKVIDDFIGTKEFEKAMSLLDSLSGEMIFDCEMRERLALLLKIIGQKGRAIEEYETLVQTYENSRLYGKAVKALKEILSMNPDFPQGKDKLNRLLSMTSKKFFDTELEKGEAEEKEELEEIEELIEEGMVDDAIEYLETKEKSKEEEERRNVYEGNTADIKPKLKIRDEKESGEGFFDLGKALKEDVGFASEEDKLLKDIFAQFKENIKEQVSLEDYKTHYNLGLAYMEMELFEDAIREFQITSNDPSIQRGIDKKFLDYCSLISNCYIKIGLFREAEEKIETGLNTQGYGQRDYIQLKFLKGTVMENSKQFQEALKIYSDILSIEPDNEEAKERIEELQKQQKNC